MKKILIIFLLLPVFSLAQTQIWAERIKKDNVTIKGNPAHEIYTDTNVVATQYYVDSVITNSSFDTTNIYNILSVKIDSIWRKAPTDSVFYSHSGTHVFAFIDSTGGGGLDTAVTSIYRKAGTDSVFKVINTTDTAFAFTDSVTAATIGATAWLLTGNAGTSPGTNFIGTTDKQNLMFKTNNTERMVLDSVGRLKLIGFSTRALYDTTNLFTQQIIVGKSVIIGDTALFAGVSSDVDSSSVLSTMAIGWWALKECQPCFKNLAIGNGALSYVKTVWNSLTDPYGSGFELIGIGDGAGHACRSCKESVFIGHNAGFYSYSAQGCTFIGVAAGMHNKANSNTFVGTFTGLENTSGAANTFAGISAGQNNTTAGDNTYVGGGAGFTNQTGVSNNALGRDALFFNTSLGNTAIGTKAGRGNTSGGLNIFIGFEAGGFNTTVSNQLFISNVTTQANYTDNVRKSLVYGIFGADSSAQSFKIAGTFKVNDGTNVAPGQRYMLTTVDGGAGKWTDMGVDTTAGDAATLNTIKGWCRKDTDGTTFVVTNSLATTSSVVILQRVTTGITAGSEMVYTPGSGSFTVTFESAGVATAPDANMDFMFYLEN